MIILKLYWGIWILPEKPRSYKFGDPSHLLILVFLSLSPNPSQVELTNFRNIVCDLGEAECR